MQGDPLSVLIFNLSQNLLSEIAQDPSLIAEAFVFSPELHQLLMKAFADDLMAASRLVAGAQKINAAIQCVYVFQRSTVNTKKSLAMAMGKR